MREDPGELGAEVLRLRGEAGDGPEADDAVRVAAEDGVLPGVELPRLDQFDGEVVSQVSPEGPAPDPGDPGRPPPARVAGLDVQQPPEDVEEADPVVVREEDVVEQEGESGRAHDQEGEQVEEHHQRLLDPRHGDPLHSHGHTL